MGSKDNGQQYKVPRQLFRLLFAGILIFLILILIVIFLVWIILRPGKPRFILEDTTVYNFNISSAGISTSPINSTFNTLSHSNMQVTLSANNPKNKIGIDYQKLDVYASYRGQQISLAAALPSTYQGHNELIVWSPYLYGTDVPLSPFLLNALEQDQKAGDVLVNVRVNGRIKWKVGTWFSTRYHIYANCPAYIKFPSDWDNAIRVIGVEAKITLTEAMLLEIIMYGAFKRKLPHLIYWWLS